MRLSVALAAMVLALGSVSCGAATSLEGSDGGRDGGVDAGAAYVGVGPLAGSYDGTATVVYTPIQPPTSPNTQTLRLTFDVAAAPASAGVDLYLTFHTTGQPTPACALGARRTGSTATVPAGQTCTVTPAGAFTRIDFTSAGGAATLAGTQLSVSLTLDGVATTPSGPMTAREQITFTGTRR